jgi:hypothetical protein
MKNLKLHVLILGAATVLTVSCKKKGCMDPLAQYYSEAAEKDDKKDPCTYKSTKPSTYTFTRNGTTTVSFSGQTIRMNMLSEMVTLMKTANTAGTSVSETTLKDMYANNGYSWTDSEGLGLTGSTKQLKNKTAFGTADGSADAGIQTKFEAYMTNLANISANTVSGEENGIAGTAGVWANDGVKGPYLMNENGQEYAQLIEKGLMCAVFLNQLTVNYLGDITNDDNTVVVEGENYTKMEHHWDEAFGYFTDATDYPTSGTDRFWGKYSEGRETILGSATKISNAFRIGRSAIVNQNYSLRDQQVVIINTELEKVVAGTAIHYLNSAKTNITNNVARNHALSEAVAFIDGLRYSNNVINNVNISSDEIDTALGYIGDNYNVVTISNLNNAIDLIASKTGLEAEKGSL